MKKIRLLLIGFILLMPIGVNAQITAQEPRTRTFDTLAECMAYTELNVAATTQNATRGFYLTCIEVTCQNGRVAQNDRSPLRENVRCANNNPSPGTLLAHAGADMEEGEYAVGATCDVNEFEPIIASAVFEFDCATRQDGTPFEDDGETTTTAPQHGGTPNENPHTAINTYYLVLTASIIVLVAGLYFINKQNLFKRI